MATPSQKLQRISAIFAVSLAAAVSSGCAARAEYVYDEPVVYRREPVYAPPPVVVYREHDHYHGHPPPRAYRAPSYRGRVGVYRAPVHVHRPPPARHEHHEHHRDHDHGRHR